VRAPAPRASLPIVNAPAQPIATSFDDAWARFLTLDSLRLAGEEQAWTHGRAQLLGFGVPVRDRDACAHLARIAERLAGISGVNILPDWSWHATVKPAGFQVIKRTRDDDVLRENVPRLAGGARALFAQEPAFQAQLGLPNAFAGAVFVELLDGGRLRGLNERLAGELGLARYPFDSTGFLPHVSLARFTSSDGLARLKETLATLRGDGAGPSFPVARVEFVKSWTIEGEPPDVQVIAAYQLRSAR
jgi:2'-5' RNA ligase